MSDITSAFGTVWVCKRCGEEYQPPFTKCSCSDAEHGHATLRQAQQAIGDRQEQYGQASEVFCTTANLFSIYLRGRVPGERDVAVFNILQKIARISHGQNHKDNWVDIAGYAALGAEVDE